jgi:hypothetical protein
MYGVPMLHFERIREVTEPIAQGHQLYAHAQVYWQQTIAPSKDVPIGPNGEVRQILSHQVFGQGSRH